MAVGLLTVAIVGVVAATVATAVAADQDTADRRSTIRSLNAELRDLDAQIARNRTAAKNNADAADREQAKVGRYQECVTEVKKFIAEYKRKGHAVIEFDDACGVRLPSKVELR